MCKCGNENVVYVYSDMKIKRYQKACSQCGRHFKWMSDYDWDKIKDTVLVISQEEHQQMKGIS